MTKWQSITGIGDRSGGENHLSIFQLQALLTLEKHRETDDPYLRVEGSNVGLEGKCLWSMAHVTRKCLGLQDRADRLYLQIATMVGTPTALLPRDEWYVESVAQIQNYRGSSAEDEIARCEWIRHRIPCLRSTGI